MQLIKLSLILLLSVAFLSCNRDRVSDTPEEVTLNDLLTSTLNQDLNPTGLTPLSSTLTFTTELSTAVKVTVTGDYPLTFSSDGYRKSHRIDIHGLYSDRNNEIVIEVLTEDNTAIATESIFIQTDTLPSFFPEIDVITMQEDQMEAGWNLIELGIGGQGFFRFHPSIFDPSGEIRYYMNLDFIQGWIGPFEQLNNGNWLWSFGNVVNEYDLMGREVNRWELPGYTQHHDQVEKPDGNLIIAVSKWDVTTSGLDHIIELDRQTGDIVREWDLREIMDVDRFDFIWNSWDWAHVNSVWYDENTDGLVISARHQGIIKVDMDNNLQWIIAPHLGWEFTGVNGDGIDTRDYLLTAVDDNGNPYPDAVQQGTEDSADGFSWGWGQHATMVLDNGNIFCFDNGTNKNFEERADFIRGVEYAIDPIAGTVQQVWQYGKERGQEIHSDNISDVDVLPLTGNRLIAPGNISNNEERQARIIEVSYPEGEVIYEAIIRFKDELSLGGGWAQTDISYRAERLVVE